MATKAKGRGRKPPKPQAGRRGADEIDAKIGAKLRQLRILHGVSQQALAEKVGLSYQQLQKYEAGTNQMSVGRLCEFAAALNEPVANFFDDLDNVMDLGNERQLIEIMRLLRETKPELRQNVLGILRASS